jgi:two-component system cell cycle sensor histidine kinase PleC
LAIACRFRARALDVFGMFREKLVSTLAWAALCVAGAMVADYVLTILVLRDYQAYTPLVTLCIATIVAVPISYALVSGRIDLRRMRDELALARDRAVQMDRVKTHFFANMSHELRTPLNAILGFSELLKLDVFAARRVEYANLIHGAGTHLLSLVDDLLDLSRIEAGKLELREQAVNLGELIEECVETVAARARTRELKIVRSVDPDLPPMLADRRAVKQILLNLLTNAIKFSKTGGTIEVFARLAPSVELMFGVRDEGVGIAEDDQDHVFERFGQARGQIVSPEKGAGLGLPIVKGLAEAHGGRIAMESRVGQGTCITVTIPPERIERPVPVALAS